MDQSGSPMPTAPMTQYVSLAPPFWAYDRLLAEPKNPLNNCHHREKTGFNVDYRQQESASCPVGIRALHDVRVPLWFEGVDVPFGSVIELSLVHCSFRDMIRADDPFTSNIPKSE